MNIFILVEKRNGNISRIILIILTLVQLQITVSIAIKRSSNLPACMINNKGNGHNRNLIVLLLQLNQEIVGISGIFSTVLETQYNDYG